MFEMFSQVDRTLDRAQGGLGIGLALVKELVTLHGGTVSGHSDGLGQGSTFTVRLPLVAAAAPEAAAPEAAPATGRRRVLVVDDNVDGAETLALLLEMSGHQARVVHDGPQALAAVREDPPEVVFLDIGLPGMSGYEVARALRESGCKALLVALTGWGSAADKREALDAGFDFHLTKPVEPGVVVSLLAAG